MATTPRPGTPAFFKVPQAQRIAIWNRAKQATGGAAEPLSYLTPDEFKFIQAANLPSWANTVKNMFPDQAAYLDVPEIADLLHLATAAKWPASELASHLAQTNWWLTHSAEQRNWYQQTVKDPAEAVRLVNQQTDVILRQAMSLGVRMNAGQAMNLATNALQYGWDPATLTDNIMQGDTQGYTHGTLGATFDQLKGQAEKYLVPMSGSGLQGWTKSIASGRADTAAYTDYLVRQAKSMFKDPELHKALDQGMTVSDFADPYVQTAAQLLGLNPKDVDLSQGKWMNAINYADPKTGEKRAQSLDEWQTNLRTDARYGYDHTQNAMNEAATLINDIKQRWGIA
jgi:hypothetical protein